MADARTLRATGALIAILALAGCTAHPVANPPNGRLTDGSTMTAAAVRTDSEPISKRFPKLGAFTEVHWQGSLLGSTDVPGPSDVHIQALIKLSPADLAAAKTAYTWEAAPAVWGAKLSDELRPFAPTTADWQYSKQYETDVETTRYAGTVYLDQTSGTVFLDVIST